ncbi:MAG: hypothetical protein F4X82_02215 [Candidatus Spechtbacteria bacterium SB0662_bin_43]|uniref:Uncharacterized protein n=1 Tax=Candidatus Spechtbacteria bacterium SB0662_bin_43 TaxID=2604897 RepID=A0A845DEA9_9BACT|nr:hypothetical protein [Candidatus Spechtbacteria bacterium SB0662_bin_43]
MRDLHIDTSLAIDDYIDGMQLEDDMEATREEAKETIKDMYHLYMGMLKQGEDEEKNIRLYATIVVDICDYRSKCEDIALDCLKDRLSE